MIVPVTRTEHMTELEQRIQKLNLDWKRHSYYYWAVHNDYGIICRYDALIIYGKPFTKNKLVISCGKEYLSDYGVIKEQALVWLPVSSEFFCYVVDVATPELLNVLGETPLHICPDCGREAIHRC